MKATTLANNGTLNLQGNTSSGTTNKASLDPVWRGGADLGRGAVRQERRDARVRQRLDRDDRRGRLARARRRRRAHPVERRGEFGAVGPDRQLRDAGHPRRQRLRRRRPERDDGEVVHQLSQRQRGLQLRRRRQHGELRRDVDQRRHARHRQLRPQRVDQSERDDALQQRHAGFAGQHDERNHQQGEPRPVRQGGADLGRGFVRQGRRDARVRQRLDRNDRRGAGSSSTAPARKS